MRPCLRLLCAVLASVCVSSPLVAQSIHRPYGQLAVGNGTVLGGVLSSRDVSVIELAFSMRPLPRTAPALTLGLLASTTMFAGGDLSCPIVPPSTRCQPFVDDFGFVGLLAGIEAHGRYGGIGVQAGPTAYASNGATLGGALARADFVTPNLGRAALVVSPQVMVVPNLLGDTHTFRALTFGLRVR